MARPKTITDEQLLQCARAVFLELGPSATVKQIAQRLNVSHAALFQRVGTKEQLMLKALSPPLPHSHQALETIFERHHPTGIAALNALLLELMRFLSRALPNLVVLRCANLGPQAPEHELPPHKLRLGLTSWLSQLRRGEQAHHHALAQGLLGAIEARCFNAYLASHAHDDVQDLTFIEALTSGLLDPTTTEET